MATKLSANVDAVHEALNDATVLKQIGRLKLKENTQRRRVVWIRAPSQVQPAKHTTGKMVGATRVIQCYSCAETVQAHILAETEELTEQLFFNVLAALHIACGPSAQPGAYEWHTEDPAISDYALRQPHVILQVAFSIPVIEKVFPLTTITAQDHVGKFGTEVVC